MYMHMCVVAGTLSPLEGGWSGNGEKYSCILAIIQDGITN